MFEFHGWAVIKSNACLDAADDDLVRELQRHLTNMTPSMQSCFHLADPLNGFHCITIAGLRNHYRHEVLGLLTWIASRSRQSYGIVFVRSDDVAGDKDAFRIHRLSCGKVEEFSDPFFS